MSDSGNSLSELLYDIRRIAENREKLSEKKIQAIYRTLLKDLDKFVADGYKKYADSDGRFYVSYLDAQNKRAGFLQEIINHVDNISPEIKKEIQSLIDDTYSKSYEGMTSAFEKASTREEFKAITKDIDVNPEVLKQSVNNNISKLTLPAVMEKHRQDTIYQIQKELSIGLMQGDRYEKMAKRISERVNVSYGKAINITRSESHRNVENGFMDCAECIQEDLEDSGLIYAATWRTMKDEKVRPSQRVKTANGWKTVKSKNGADHQKMEGVIVKAGELFDLGNGVKAKNPGNSGVAAHDCNCRCFIEYNLLTEEEFAKAVGKKFENKKKDGVDNLGESGIIKEKEISLQNQLSYIYRGEKLFIPKDTIINNCKTIAGKGSFVKIRVVNALVNNYGGEISDWKKRVGKIESEKYVFDVHWYELDGKQYGMKLKNRGDKK